MPYNFFCGGDLDHYRFGPNFSLFLAFFGGVWLDGMSSGNFGLDFLEDVLTPMSIVFNKVNFPLMF